LNGRVCSPRDAARTTLKQARHDSAAVRRAQSHQKCRRGSLADHAAHCYQEDRSIQPITWRNGYECADNRRHDACTSAGAGKGTLARSSKQVNRTVNRGEALRQQRGDFVRANRYESARRDGVVASDRTAGQDREDGQKAAKRKAAVAAVGDGAFRTKTSRLTAFPPNQRASDSHDYTRLAALKVLNASLRKRTGRLKKRDAG
jgi:hypothetical protein